MKHTPLAVTAIIIIGIVAVILFTNRTEAPVISETPAPTTPAVTEPAPATKDDLIVLDSPLPGSAIASPLTITGKARGTWFFEGSFPVTLVNWDGLIIADGYATAQGEWMTTEYVPFVGTITFEKPDTEVSDRGWIILKKDNPSGEPQFDNALEVEIKYQ